MKAIIAKFYKKLKDAEKHAKEMRKLWRGKVEWFVVQYDGGNLVISESVVRGCFPELIREWSYKNKK